MKRALILVALLAGSDLLAAVVAQSSWRDAKGVTWYYSMDGGVGSPPNSVILLPQREGMPCTDNPKGDITVPATVGNGFPVCALGSFAFQNCAELTSVTIPNSVDSIGSEVFINCSGLKSITFPAQLPTVGTKAFLGCTSLPSDGTCRYSDETKTILLGLEEDADRTNGVVIPEGVTTIAGCAFYNPGYLPSVTLPESLRVIGKSAFAYCQLSSLTVPGGLESIGEDAFERCTNLQTITFTGAPPTCEFPEEWNTIKITWYYPSTHRAEWQAALDEERWGMLFAWAMEYTVEPELTFDETVPEASQAWLKEVLAAAGIVEGTVTVDGNTASLGRLQALGVTPGYQVQDGSIVFDLQDGTVIGQLKEAFDKGELVGPEQIKEAATQVPLMQVQGGTATVGFSVRTTATLDGTWEALKPMDCQIGEYGTVCLTFQAGEGAAFYKFVVPEGLHTSDEPTR